MDSICTAVHVISVTMATDQGHMRQLFEPPLTERQTR